MQEFKIRIKNRIVGIMLFMILTFFLLRHSLLIDVSLISVFSSYAIYPFLRMQQRVIEPIQCWLSCRATMEELKEKVAFISRQNEQLTAENISLQALNYYVKQTAELRAFNKKYALEKGQIVEVMARHFSVNSQFFFMNAGIFQGIKKDMIALYGNSIVGRVSEVYPWYCKVILVTDAECKVAAVCPQTGASGIHEGTNDLHHTVLSYVSHLEKVIPQSLVLSSGEGLIFPSGFALGIIESLYKEELFYSIQVKPMINFQDICYCTLIAKEEIAARQAQ